MAIYTIGHSTHTQDEFIEILKAYDIELLVDVRSLPGSNYVPHFNQDNMKKWLKKVVLCISMRLILVEDAISKKKLIINLWRGGVILHLKIMQPTHSVQTIEMPCLS